MSTAADFSSEVGKAHGPNWSEWLGHLAGKHGASGLELGTWRGESAEWMLENIFTGTGAHYWCVDTFKGSEEHALAGIDCSQIETKTRARLERFGNRAQIFRSTSNRALRGFLRYQLFDFVYVDAAHDAMNVMRDSVLAWDMLQVGGVMIWDDFEWTGMADELDRPKMAIDAFLASYSRQLEVIGMGWQVAARKVA